MIDWIKSWFGRGRVKAEWIGIDNEGWVRTSEAQAPYVGKYDDSAMKKYITDQLDFKFGIKAPKITIVRHTEE